MCTMRVAESLVDFQHKDKWAMSSDKPNNSKAREFFNKDDKVLSGGGKPD